MSQFSFAEHAQRYVAQRQYAKAAQAAAACQGRIAYAGVTGTGVTGTVGAVRDARARRSPWTDPREAFSGFWSARQRRGSARDAARPVSQDVPRTLAEAYATLHLDSGAPAAVVKAAYRALAQQHHPDAGGDTQAMVRLNAAYAAIQRRAV